MGERSKIEWTDHTFNPWWGCQRVSPACEHCYAESLSNRFGGSPWAKGEHWGPGSLRTVAGEKAWAQPVKWNADALKAGIRRRVFCASMADVFEARDDLDAPRARLFDLIEATPALGWLLLTKRPDEMAKRAPDRWASGWPANVWAGTTVEDQRRADERIPHLLRVPARVRFLSCEPMVGEVDLSPFLDQPSGCCAVCGWVPVEGVRRWREIHGDAGACMNCGASAWDSSVSWVIIGAESMGAAKGGKRPSRATEEAWVESLVGQCRDAEVPVFVKQLDRGGVIVPRPKVFGREWSEVPDAG